MKKTLWRSDAVPHQDTEWTATSFANNHAIVHLATHLGGPRSRYSNNQDVVFLIAQEEKLRFGIADGAGSTSSGQRAAAIYADMACDHDLSLAKTFFQADQQIRLETRTDGVFDSNTSGYGAALCCEWVTPDRIRIGTWGDCRALLVRAGNIVNKKMTAPQNALFADYQAGKTTLADYYRAEGPSYLTGGIGLGDLENIEEPNIYELSVNPGDLLIIGSDGLWDVVTDFEVLNLTSSVTDASILTEMLCTLAFQKNNATESIKLELDQTNTVSFLPDGGDNISIGVVTFLA